MRRFIVTKTQVWEVEVPDVGVDVDEEINNAMEDDPDYEGVEVEDL